MVSALFTAEVTTIESQIAQLQSQIAQLESRRTTLSECESEADGMLQVVQKTLGKISALAPDAIATLKASVLSLFNNSGGDQSELSLSNTFVEKSPAPQADPLLNGQSCAVDLDAYWATQPPDGSCCPLASPLCCQMEDAPLLGQACLVASCLEDCPAESLQGQVVELACLIGHPELCSDVLLEAPLGFRHEGLDDRLLPTKLVPVEVPTLQARIAIDKALGEEIEESEKYIDLVPVNDRVAYQRRNDGAIIAVYAGGTNKGKLKNWGDWLTRTHSVTHGYELREAKRLSTKWELKLTPMTLAQIERLASCDFSKDPRSCYPDAPKREHPLVPTQIELDGYKPGDVVKSVTVKSWQYRILEVRRDGILECQRINVDGVIKASLHPASVELVRKADAVDESSVELVKHLEAQVQAIAPGIDETDVPRGVVLKPKDDDLLVESTVWMWALVRNQGVPEKQLKQIGRLVEGINGIEAYRPRAGICQVFSRTLHAVDYLIQCSGQKPADILERIDHYQRLQSQKNEALVGATVETEQILDDEF